MASSHLRSLILGLVAAAGFYGCSLFEPCDKGDSGAESNACFSTECRIGESCGVKDRWLAGSNVPLEIRWRESEESSEDGPPMDVSSEKEVFLEGSWECLLDCEWVGELRSERAQTVRIDVHGPDDADAQDPLQDSIELNFERASSLEAKVVRDEVFSDPELERDGEGVSLARVSDRNIQVHLVARNGKGEEIRVHNGGYVARILRRGEAELAGLETREEPRGKFALKFSSAGDAVIQITTVNTDDPVSIDIPVRISE